MKKKICIDIDGVVADQIEPIITIIKEEFGVVAKYEDIKHYSFEKSLSLPPGADSQIIHIYNSTCLSSVLPLPGAIQGVQFLASVTEAEFVTSRKDENGSTANWLSKYGIEGVPIRFVPHSEKANYFTTVSPDYVLEDSLEISIAAAGAGFAVFLYDAPWNRSAEHPKLSRIDSWVHFMEKWREVND